MKILKLLSENTKYQGDSNPLKLPWINTWHQAQHIATNNPEKAVKIMMLAVKQAKAGGSVAEAKYYLGTVAWLRGDYEMAKRMSTDTDVKASGNDVALCRLLQNIGKPYDVAYNK